jgi:hypothetical protein
MADISITAANVVTVAGVKDSGTAGATITAGQAVYKKASDGKFYLADADAASVAGNAEIDNVYGIALNGASSGQPLSVQISGTITIGGTITAAGTIWLSDVAGGITETWADLDASDYVTIIGHAISASVLKLDINILGIVKP